MVICNLNELDRGQYEEKFGEVDWRELSYTYMDIMQKIGDPCFQYFVNEDIIFPFYKHQMSDGKTENEKLLNEFIDILGSNFNDLQLLTYLVFVPLRINVFREEVITQWLYEICCMLKREECSILFFYSEKLERFKAVFENSSCISKVCSYNTMAHIMGRSMGEFLCTLNGKKRANIRRYLERFQKSPFTFKEINVSTEWKRMEKLYIETCKKYDEPYENKKFWEYLATDTIPNLKWLGIYHGETLVLFNGYWIDGDSAIMSMTGKDYKYESEVREWCAYLILFYKNIERAIGGGMKHLYNGYGLQEMKAKFGFAATNYIVTII